MCLAFASILLQYKFIEETFYAKIKKMKAKLKL